MDFSVSKGLITKFDQYPIEISISIHNWDIFKCSGKAHLITVRAKGYLAAKK